MTVSTIPPVTPLLKFFDNNGAPLAYGQLFTYQTGTSTKQATYTDSTGNTPNTNPIILNARGECSVWLDSALVYKFVLSPPTDTDPPSSPIGSPMDPIGAFNITQVTGSFTTITVSAQGQIAYLNITGSTIPANGLYLPAVNRLGFATNTKARGYIDSGGIWTILAPDASGPALSVAALGANNTNTIQLPTAGSLINFARASDGALNCFVGSRAATSSTAISIYNSAASTAEIVVDGGQIGFYTNGGTRGNVAVGGQWQFFEPYNSISALRNAATQETGSFSATITGCTSAPAQAVVYSRTGNLVNLNIQSLTAVSNTTALTLTGLPANLQPIRTQRGFAAVTDNAVTQAGLWSVSIASGTITLFLGFNVTGFTNSGTKGTSIFNMTYSLD